MSKEETRNKSQNSRKTRILEGTKFAQKLGYLPPRKELEAHYLKKGILVSKKTITDDLKEIQKETGIESQRDQLIVKLQVHPILKPLIQLGQYQMAWEELRGSCKLKESDFLKGLTRQGRQKFFCELSKDLEEEQLNLSFLPELFDKRYSFALAQYTRSTTKKDKEHWSGLMHHLNNYGRTMGVKEFAIKKQERVEHENSGQKVQFRTDYLSKVQEDT